MKCKLQDFTNEMTDDQMNSREDLDTFLSEIMSQLSNKERNKLLLKYVQDMLIYHDNIKNIKQIHFK